MVWTCIVSHAHIFYLLQSRTCLTMANKEKPHDRKLQAVYKMGIDLNNTRIKTPFIHCILNSIDKIGGSCVLCVFQCYCCDHRYMYLHNTVTNLLLSRTKQNAYSNTARAGFCAFWFPLINCGPNGFFDRKLFVTSLNYVM